jgi:tetratricopeptide (TPR) repeat protein
MTKHLWLCAPRAASWAALYTSVDLPPVLADLDAHRRLRGPYTAAGTLVRRIVPDICVSASELVTKHDIEILTAAPELRAVIAGSRETLTSLADPKSRTRYYPYERTKRIAHGLTELITAYVHGLGEPRTLVITHTNEADHTDAEWLAIMLRRVDPAYLRLVVCTTTEDIAEPLGAALQRYAIQIVGAPCDVPPPLPVDPELVHALAAQYIATDCTRAEPLWQAAYAAVPAEQRAQLHDARADALEACGEFSLRLGAICYHREHGTDPTGAGVAALGVALSHCVMEGFYNAVLELGHRCLALADWTTQHDECWLATVKMTIALSTQGRADEALALYDAACAASTAQGVHMQSAYGRAMLYTRYFEASRRDLARAKMWINTAIAFAAMAPEEKRRAYHLTFNENGLALIAMHLGDPAEALRLVTAGITRFEAELPPGEYTLHESVLRYNRAQLVARMGTPEEAVAAYTAVIESDPHHNEYYFERAVLLRQLGRYDEALADYDATIRNSPPYYEPYYNRGDLRAALGDVAGALADYDYVLELDPDVLDAYVNRAALRYEQGDATGAAADVAEGLARDPQQPHLLCLRGLLALDEGHPDEARLAFQAALHADPTMAGAWANLGVLAFEQGDAEEAVQCFDHALALQDDPAVRANRAQALACLEHTTADGAVAGR